MDKFDSITLALSLLSREIEKFSRDQGLVLKEPSDHLEKNNLARGWVEAGPK